MELRRYVVTCTTDPACTWRIKCYGHFPRRAWSEFMRKQWADHRDEAHPDVVHPTGMIANVNIDQFDDYREI